jgi:uncharacterized protein YkwD
MIRSAFLAAAAVAVALACAPSAHAASMPSSRAIVHELNVARHAHGLPSLRTSAPLRRTADRFTRAMLAGHFFDHRGFASRAANVPFHTVGETLAWSEAPSARQIVTDWLNSPGHRAIVLGRFRAVGVGVRPGTPQGTAGATVTADYGR